MNKFVFSLKFVFGILCIVSSQRLSSKNPKLLEGKGNLLHRLRRDQYAASFSRVPKNQQQLLLDYGWSPRQLNSFSTTNLLGLGSSQLPPADYIYPGGAASSASGSEEDNAVAAGHNHGWGWGHGHGHKHKNDVNNSAVGMLGFLALLALIQMNMNNNMNNNMNMMRRGQQQQDPPPTGMGTIVLPGGPGGRPPAGGGRKRRSVLASTLPYSQLNNATEIILPFLLTLNHIREGDWPLECSQYTICSLSQTVSQGIDKTGWDGQLLRRSLREVMEELLVHSNLVSTHSEEDALREKVDWATTLGMSGVSCAAHFKKC